MTPAEAISVIEEALKCARDEAARADEICAAITKKPYETKATAFIRKALAALPALKQEWWDISTAPKIGARILVDNPSWSRKDSPEIVFWNGSWWEGADISYSEQEPTHWMPLPQPPKQSGE